MSKNYYYTAENPNIIIVPTVSGLETNCYVKETKDSSPSPKPSLTHCPNPNLIVIPTTSHCSPLLRRQLDVPEQQHSPDQADLSFLDDIDIDEIVKSLDACDSTIVHSKETKYKSIRNNNKPTNSISKNMRKSRNEATNTVKKVKSVRLEKQKKNTKEKCTKEVVNKYNQKSIVKENKNVSIKSKTKPESKSCNKKISTSAFNITRITLHIKAIKKKQSANELNQDKRAKKSKEISKTNNICADKANSIEDLKLATPLKDTETKNTNSQNHKENLISQIASKKITNCVGKFNTGVTSGKSRNVSHLPQEDVNVKNISDLHDFNSKVNEQYSKKDLKITKNKLEPTSNKIQKPKKIKENSKKINPYSPVSSKISFNNLDVNNSTKSTTGVKHCQKKELILKKGKSQNGMGRITQKTSGNLENIQQFSSKTKPENISKDLKKIEVKNVGPTCVNIPLPKKEHEKLNKIDFLENIQQFSSKTKPENISKDLKKIEVKNVEPTCVNISLPKKEHEKLNKIDFHLSKSSKIINNVNVSSNINKTKIKEPINSVISHEPNPKQNISENDVINFEEPKTKDLECCFRSDLKKNNNMNKPIKSNCKLNKNNCENKSNKTVDLPRSAIEILKHEGIQSIGGNNTLEIKSKIVTQSQKETNDSPVINLPLLSEPLKQRCQTNKVNNITVSDYKKDLKSNVKNEEKANQNERGENVTILKQEKNSVNQKKRKSIDMPEINSFKKKSINVKDECFKIEKDCTSENTSTSSPKFIKSVVKSADVILLNKLEICMNKGLDTKYSAFSLIHYGRFSKIFKCKNSDGQMFSVKILRKNWVNYILKNDNIISQIQADIPKENLFCVYFIDSFTFDKSCCYLMEYYPKTLKDALVENKTPFHIDDVENLTRQLVAAITLLRCHGVVHSDIKPSHILLDDSNKKLRLCGFDASYYDQEGVLPPNMGKACYRSPEVIVGHSGGFSVDVWSTAVVMYEMITGQKLFPGTYCNQVLYKQMSILGHLPYNMINTSKYKNRYFHNKVFLRTLGKEATLYVPIHKFVRKQNFLSPVYAAYDYFWLKERNKTEQEKDKQKIASFNKLLEQMLVMHPAYRLSIEFVHANPFLYDIYSY